jgi:preprotein translocase subunit YajC
MSLLSDASPILAQQSSAGGGSGQIIFLVLMFAAMYFFMIAPQRKKQKEHAKMMESLSTGDEIITTGGLYGEITNKKDDRFVIRIAEGTKVEVSKAFIHALVKKSN